MTLRLFNTLTKSKDVFTPLDPKNVRMYVCGPTVYDFAHIGNARPAIVFDVLFRLLRHEFGEKNVTYARNITDVDDKINDRAAEVAVKKNISVEEARVEVTSATERQYFEDVRALGCLDPSISPRATEHIPQMVSMIKRLIATGNAYEAEGHVLFDVTSKPDYGKLSRRSLEEMIAGSRVEVAPYKRNPMDFVLWKPSDDVTPGWTSPWGRGRPGWHIECSSMIESELGPNLTVDIHGGGIDLVFPHHENELAQSECAHHFAPLANVWMHNGFLQVEGEKMSKSLGNFVTIRELLTGWHNSTWPGDQLRFNMLRTHYRQPIDWTIDGLEEAHKTLWEWQDAYQRARIDSSDVSEVPPQIFEALNDDLNVPKVFAELHSLKRYGDIRELRASAQFLGFTCDAKKLGRTISSVARIQGESRVFGVGDAIIQTPYGAISLSEISLAISARSAARDVKNFAESDRIRDDLLAQGIVLKDGPDGTSWEIKR